MTIKVKILQHIFHCRQFVGRKLEIHLRIKTDKLIALLHKVKELLNDEALYILYNIMVTPHLTYCINFRGKAYKMITNPTFILQKDCKNNYKKTLW